MFAYPFKLVVIVVAQP